MWIDHTGLERTGEIIDSVTVEHPQRGTTHATLYRADPGRIVLELAIGGKTHEYPMESEQMGRERMAHLRKMS